MYSPYLKQHEPLKKECQHFLDCIKTGEKTESCGYKGLKFVRILEAASESLRREGARVDIAEIDQRQLTQDQENDELKSALAL